MEPGKPQPSEQASPEVSPSDCKHPDWKLEQSEAAYLTGWYICLKCGERFKTI